LFGPFFHSSSSKTQSEVATFPAISSLVALRNQQQEFFLSASASPNREGVDYHNNHAFTLVQEIKKLNQIVKNEKERVEKLQNQQKFFKGAPFLQQQPETGKLGSTTTVESAKDALPPLLVRANSTTAMLRQNDDQTAENYPLQQNRANRLNKHSRNPSTASSVNSSTANHNTSSSRHHHQTLYQSNNKQQQHDALDQISEKDAIDVVAGVTTSEASTVTFRAASHSSNAPNVHHVVKKE
jgi:hypothetical protein